MSWPKAFYRYISRLLYGYMVIYDIMRMSRGFEGDIPEDQHRCVVTLVDSSFRFKIPRLCILYEPDLISM